MIKAFKIYTLQILWIFSSFAQADIKASEKYIHINKLLADKYADSDIGHIFLAPQFEKIYDDQIDPSKIITIEMSYGEIDNSDASKRRIQWLKNQILQDKRINSEFRSQIIAYSGSDTNLEDNSEVSGFIEEVALSDTKVEYDNIPAGLSLNSGFKTSSYQAKGQRSPAGFINGRTLWTLIRITTLTGGTYASIYYSKDVHPMAAFAIGLTGGLVSGAITYYSAEYGRFLTSGAWTKWLFESDNAFSKSLRKGLGLDGESLAKVFISQKEKLIKEVPELLNHPEVFDEIHWKRTIQEFDNNAAFRKSFLSKFGQAEEYFKWWLTDVAYAGVAMKLPQAIAGIGAESSLLVATSEILSGATMGVLAQGPGDIAIQQRKYQKVVELKDAINNGTKVVRDKQLLLDEIEKVLAKDGKYATYVIHDGSHQALRAIENWSRSRATLLSFFSVVGVGMEIAQIPLSRPLLITLGTGGAFYYAHVNEVFPAGSRVQRYTSKVLSSFESLELKAKSVAKSGMDNIRSLVLPKRYCNSFFIPNN